MVGEYSTFIINVTVNNLPTVDLCDQSLTKGENLNIYLGNMKVQKVIINGLELSKSQYEIKDMILTISSTLLNEGENTLTINEDEIVVTVKPVSSSTSEIRPDVKPNDNPEKPVSGCKGSIGISIVSMMVLLGLVVLKKKNKEREC